MRMTMIVALLACGGSVFTTASAVDVTLEVKASLVADSCILNDRVTKSVDFGKIEARDLSYPSSLARELPISILSDGKHQNANLQLFIHGEASPRNQSLFTTNKDDLGIAGSYASLAIVTRLRPSCFER